MAYHANGRPLPGILDGVDEPIFGVLPDRVLANLRYSGSENARLWNLMYPLARPALSLRDLLKIRPLWGTVDLGASEDELVPYYWGYRSDGTRLDALDDALQDVDGAGHKTEVDLFLLGRKTLVLVEAKHASGFGRCARFSQDRCPEVHGSRTGGGGCRYWETRSARFDAHLALGERPAAYVSAPVCARHYQLARSLLVGSALADRLNRGLYFWLLTPRRHWRSLQRDWRDFSDRVKDDDLWRRLRVLGWEDVARLRRTPRRLD